jgi:uncharacterized protein (DUF4213/DUF364 family)
MFILCRNEDLLSQPVRVRARVLTAEEAIGNPEADDFPLQKGKERLMQAEFFNALGQAFTDRYGDFEGVLDDVLKMSLENNFRRAVFVATLNAVLRHTDRITGTVHCRDRGPGECAVELVHYLKARHDTIKIAQVGFQPRMVESLAVEFPLRVLDMDPENIGSRKFEIPIEGPENTEDAIEWADLLLVTGTTLVNNTIEDFLNKKPLIFYGTTIAGAAHLMNWDRFCASST